MRLPFRKNSAIFIERTVFLEGHVSTYFRQKRIGQPGVFAPARDALHRPYRRIYEHDYRLLQHPPLPRPDGSAHRRQRQDVCPALVARRNHRPARPDIQPGPAPLQGGIRAARTQVYHRLQIYADPHDHLPRGRRDPAEGDAVDTQAHAADDPLHARRRPFGNAPPAAAFPRLSRQTRADACQHGGRRALLPGSQRREMPPLRVVPVALPADQQARCGIRARARLVLRIRIPAGSGPRL